MDSVLSKPLLFGIVRLCVEQMFVLFYYCYVRFAKVLGIFNFCFVLIWFFYLRLSSSLTRPRSRKHSQNKSRFRIKGSCWYLFVLRLRTILSQTSWLWTKYKHWCNWVDEWTTMITVLDLCYAFSASQYLTVKINDWMYKSVK